MDDAQKLDVITNYVFAQRRRQDIKDVDRTHKPEPSSESFGEFNLLLDRQLLTTEVGFGGWQELMDSAVLNGVYDTVQRRISQGIHY